MRQVKRITPLLALTVLAAGCGSAQGTTPLPSPPPAGPPSRRIRLLGPMAFRRAGCTRFKWLSEIRVKRPFISLMSSLSRSPSGPSRRDSGAVIGKTERTDLPIPYGAATCSPAPCPRSAPPPSWPTSPPAPSSRTRSSSTCRTPTLSWPDCCATNAPNSSSSRRPASSSARTGSSRARSCAGASWSPGAVPARSR